MTSKEALAFISKKAIQYIKGSYPVIDNEGFENYEKSQMVLGVLIERDTPMKPEFKINIQNGKVDFVCLSCGFSVKFKDNYCSHCGQMLDW